MSASRSGLLAALCIAVSAATAATCSWPGHCLGDRCRTYNDCDGAMICVSRRCANGECPFDLAGMGNTGYTARNKHLLLLSVIENPSHDALTIIIRQLLIVDSFDVWTV